MDMLWGNSSEQSLCHRITKTMPTLSERQDQTAIELVRKLHGLNPARESFLNLTGAVGSGKTSVLRRVVDELHREKTWIPVFVTAPNREYDSGPVALLEAASQLKASQLLNGEVEILSDPRRGRADKMAAITEVVDRHREEVVILCDEPTFWYEGDESLLEDTPQYSARSFAEWVASGARCRRIITGRIPGDARPAARVRAPGWTTAARCSVVREIGALLRIVFPSSLDRSRNRFPTEPPGK